MNIKVYYHSSTGNTEKIARAIAGAAQTTATAVDQAPRSINEPIDLLFLGDGIYAGKPNKAMIAFIDSLDAGKIKKAAVFATYGGQDKIGGDLKSRLEQKGINVIEAPFTCKGQAWLFMNRNRPGEAEFEQARQFAAKVIVKAGQ